MKKILRYISTGVGFLFLWFAITSFKGGLSYSDERVMILFSMLFILPIGILFRWLSLIGLGMNSRKKMLKILDNIFVIFILEGIVTLIGFTNALIAIGFPIYLAFFSVGALLIAIGGIGLFILNRIPLEKRKLHENSDLH